MSVVEFLIDGTLLFNWDSLPDSVKVKQELRDKLFEELKAKYPPETRFDNRSIFDMNQYVINRLKQELKKP
jgi:hypothetical protein